MPVVSNLGYAYPLVYTKVSYGVPENIHRRENLKSYNYIWGYEKEEVEYYSSMQTSDSCNQDKCEEMERSP
jgi:hypothetical protein